VRLAVVRISGPWRSGSLQLDSLLDFGPEGFIRGVDQHVVRIWPSPPAVKEGACRLDAGLGLRPSVAADLRQGVDRQRRMLTYTLPGQRAAPCNAAVGEETINGNCWVYIFAVKPPCGILFRQGDKCYRPVAAEPKKPTGP